MEEEEEEEVEGVAASRGRWATATHATKKVTGRTNVPSTLTQGKEEEVEGEGVEGRRMQMTALILRQPHVES